MSEWVNNEDLYRKVSAPKSERDAQTALECFWQEVQAARETYQIAEVICAVQVYIESDGKVRPAFALLQNGNLNEHESMAMLTLARVRKARADAMAKDQRGDVVDTEGLEPPTDRV